jgi:hypothetical protein
LVLNNRRSTALAAAKRVFHHTGVPVSTPLH